MSATDKLTELLRAAGAIPSFDPDRNITKPCVHCGTTTLPRDLVVVGTWSRQFGNCGREGEPIHRPMCSECALMTTPKPAVKTWRYHLPSIKGEGWAIAFLDSVGVFTYVSDWGDGGHRWPQAGWGPGDFRQFFLQCDDHYILGKIARRDTYDDEATLRAVKEWLVDARRDGQWDKEKTRREWDQLEDHGDLGSREEFAMWYEHTEIPEAYRLMVTSYSGEVRGFIEHVMPRLRDVIRAELAAEGLAP